ncbi:MAG: hypothetical protein CM15mP123_13210 [Gammaproteobacteria bacterium]|nr:MAG: hypothetical protein CM15mP123_13210 [Gammaproteobacteria bacterium]
MRRLLDELRAAEEKLKVTKEAHDLSVKQRFSGGLIKKYQDKNLLLIFTMKNMRMCHSMTRQIYFL